MDDVVEVGRGMAGELAVERGPLFTKLRPGPGLPAAEVLADQRRRLHGAIIALVDGDGWKGVRVRSLTRVAGVSTSTFYKHFPNADQCFASAFDETMRGALKRSAAARRGRRDWRAGLVASVRALMDDFASEPRAARIALIDVFSAGPEARRRIRFAVADLERHVAACLEAAPRPVPAPRHLVAGMTAGMVRVARHTTVAGRGDELPDLASELSAWMLSLPDQAVISLLRSAGDSTQGRGDRVALPPVADRPERGTADVRERTLRAAARVALMEGFDKLTASRVRADAGVTRCSFEAEFADLDECFLDAVEVVGSEALGRAVAWSADTSDWAVRTCRAVLALCVQAARERPAARLVFLEIFGPGKVGLLRRERFVTKVAEALRSTIPEEQRPSPLVAEASVAAAWHIAQADIAAGRARQLPQVASLFSYIVLTPVIGPETATRAIREASAA
jgi:AcrR family transcriptional regulator